MSTFYITSGVYAKELDLTNRALPISTTINGVAFPSRQGPADDYFCTDLVDFDEKYGGEDYQWTFAHGCIKAFLKQGKGIWLRRLTKNALYAGNVVANDVGGSRGNVTSVLPFPAGRSLGFDNDGQEYQHITFSDVLVTGNNVSVTLRIDDDTEQTFTQAFSTSNDETLRLLAANINTALNSNVSVPDRTYRPGYADVATVSGSTGTSNRVIRVMSPQNRDITFTAGSVTNGITQPRISFEQNPWIMEVYAYGPGKRSNDVGYKFVNVDNGVNQRLQLNFSAPMSTNTSFSMIVNVNGQTYTIDPVAYNTSQIQTAQDIVNTFKSTLGEQADAWVNDTVGLSLTFVSPVDGPKTMTLSNVTINNTDTIQTVVSETLSGIDQDQTFEMWIYKRSNTSTPVEKKLVSLVHQTDGYGRQLFIEDAINTSGGKSDYIRVKFNHLNGSASIKGVPFEGSQIYWLSGGYDGILPSNSDIANGYKTAFSSRRKRPLRIMMSAGQSAPVVEQAIDALCQKRRDCFGILDIPSESQTAQAAVAHRQSLMGIDSSYSAAYTPDVVIPNEQTNSPMFLPPSGHVAAQFAYNDQRAAEWLAPAGRNRGMIGEIQGLRVDYSEGDLELLVAAQLNPIVKVDSGGYKISEALTLQTKASALSNISVRRLMITVETTLVEALDYSVYEPNTDFTGFLIVQICTNFLQPIKDAQGLYDFAVVSDSRNTKDYDIDGGQRNVDVYLKPVLPIRYIQLTSVITKTGAFFQEIIAGINGGTITA